MIFPKIDDSHMERRPLLEDRFFPWEAFRRDILFDPICVSVLPSQPDPARFESILEMGCGMGWWLIDTAQAHPEILRLIGLEATALFLESAEIFARGARVHDRVRFVRGDGLAPLPFPDASFDVLHQRFGGSMGKIRTDEWSQVLHEYQRVSVPGGVVCLTEVASALSRSPALERFTSLIATALEQAGYRFPACDSQAIHLSRVLEQAGVNDVKQQEVLLAFGPTDPEMRNKYLVNVSFLIRALIPFLCQQIGLAEHELHQLSLHMVEECEHPDFEAQLTLVAVWGTVPPRTRSAPGVSMPSDARANILARTRQAEQHCLYEQDRFFTEKMGALVPSSSDLALVNSVFDVGCGPGGWLIETARRYPHLKRLVGIEANPHLVGIANQRAEAAGVADRVQFQTGDALRPLDFPDGTFSLVNQRFGMRHTRTWQWSNPILEYRRVAGLVCLTEASLLRSNSPALEWLMERYCNALFAAGYLFTPDRQGLLDHVPRKMEDAFVRVLHQEAVPVSFGSPDEHALGILDRGFEAMGPFIQKWCSLDGSYPDRYEQMRRDIRHRDFEANFTLLTVWGYGAQP